MLYTERVISKETLDEVNRLGGVLGDDPLYALHTTVSEDPSKLKVFASVLLKSEQTVPVAKDILREYGRFLILIIIIFLFYLKIKHFLLKSNYTLYISTILIKFN